MIYGYVGRGQSLHNNICINKRHISSCFPIFLRCKSKRWTLWKISESIVIPTYILHKIPTAQWPNSTKTWHPPMTIVAYRQCRRCLPWAKPAVICPRMSFRQFFLAKIVHQELWQDAKIHRGWWWWHTALWQVPKIDHHSITSICDTEPRRWRMGWRGRTGVEISNNQHAQGGMQDARGGMGEGSAE